MTSREGLFGNGFCKIIIEDIGKISWLGDFIENAAYKGQMPIYNKIMYGVIVPLL